MTSLARRLWLPFKLGVTLLLIGWLLSRIDVRAALEGVGRIGWPLWLGLLLLHTLSYLLGLWRWWLLLSSHHPEVGWRPLLPSYYAGVFLNHLLPTGVGGDLLRGGYLYRRGLSGHVLLNATLLDRLFGLAALLLMGLLAGALVALPPWGQPWQGALLLGAGATTGVLLMTFSGVGLGLARRWQWRPWQKLLASLDGYRGRWRLLSAALLLSAANQLLVILCIALLGREFGIELQAGLWIWLLAWVFLAANLPLSLGGLGPREGALTGLLLLLGHDVQQGAQLAFAYLLVLWSAALPGAVMLLLLPRSTSQTKDTDAKPPHHP